MGGRMSEQSIRTLRQRLAVSAILVDCEAIAASGYLPGRQEMYLRQLIADVRAAFGPDIPERQERGSNVVSLRPDTDFIRALNAVSQEMT
jgi:hypothetical protein